MKLPNLNEAVVREPKIVDYLLSTTHRDGKGKAEFFLRFGFKSQDWQKLAEALKAHAAGHEVRKIETSPFGMRYIIEGEMQTPDGRKPNVRAIWFIDNGDTVPHLVTAYPV